MTSPLQHETRRKALGVCDGIDHPARHRVLDRDVTGRLYRKAPADVSLFGWQSEMHVDSVREVGRVSRKELEKDTVSGGSVCSVATVRISVNVLGLDLIPTGRTKDVHRVGSGNVYPRLPSGEERALLQCRQRR